MSKKYFWLKLHNDFFNQLEIKRLRLLEKGDLYTIIYLKLQLLSITTNGQLFSKILEDSLVEELALEINETLENVQGTLLLLEKYHLLEIIDESCLLLPKVLEVIGSEAASTERVRKMRGNNLAQALQCNTDVTKCNTEIDLEIKKEINVELRSDKALAENLKIEVTKTLPVNLKTKLEQILPVQVISELANTLSVKVPPTLDLTSSLDPALTVALADDYASTTPIDNNYMGKLSSAAEKVAVVSPTTPIIAIAPQILSARELRLVRESLHEEQVTKRKMQIITERLLARLEQEKLTAPAPVTIFVPTIRVEDSFEDFWKSHPNAYDRPSTLKAWQQTLAQGISAADLVYAAKKYALKMKNNQTLLCYIGSSRNFLLNDKFWEFLPTYSLACPHCSGKGSFAKTNISGEQNYYSCNCHQRLSRQNSTIKASA